MVNLDGFEVGDGEINLLYVCTNDIIRSWAAEFISKYLLKNEFSDLSKRLNVSSAGLRAGRGGLVQEMADAVKSCGYKVPNGEYSRDSTQLYGHLLYEQDIVVPMTTNHVGKILDMVLPKSFDECKDSYKIPLILTLSEFGGDKRKDIISPYTRITDSRLYRIFPYSIRRTRPLFVRMVYYKDEDKGEEELLSLYRDTAKQIKKYVIGGLQTLDKKIKEET